MLVILMDMADTPSDKKKVEALYQKYDRLMYYTAGKILDRHEDIEDAVMEAWTSIIRNLNKISEIDCPKTMSYMVIIVERASINIYNRNNRKTGIEIPIEDFEKSPFFATEDKEIKNVEINEIFRQLPKKYSEPLIMYYVNELTVPDIAKKLNLSTDAVYKRINRGRKEFEKRWKE